MMMPTPPTPDLVVPQPHVLFAILQDPLNPVALSLHERQPGSWRVGGRVTEAILDLGRGIHFSANDHLPRPRLGLFAIPQPHLAMQEIHLQPAFGAVAHGHPLPGLGGLLLGPAIDSHRWRVRLAAGQGTTTWRRGGGHAWLGIVQVDPLVAVYIAHEDLALVVERTQKR